MTHAPVMLQEALQGLNIKPHGVYVDGTFGRGGHAQAVLGQLSSQGSLIAFDKDPEAIVTAKQLQARDVRFQSMQANFSDIKNQLLPLNVVGKVDGLLIDLGVSSPQLDDSSRGFSLQYDGPLDMRMDNTQGQTAEQWLREATLQQMQSVFREYGEEPLAGRFARMIVDARQQSNFTSTVQFASFIEQCTPMKIRVKSKKHPATRVFQAIRIHLNQELQSVEHLLRDVVDLLANEGRLVAISFHSLEDRLLKRFLKKQQRGDIPHSIPILEKQSHSRDYLRIVGAAIKPTSREINQNKRARSAIMRVAEKVVVNQKACVA